MAYAPLYKRYDSDGNFLSNLSTIVSGAYSLSAQGGCNASRIVLENKYRESYLLDRDDEIRIYYESGGTLLWSGTVESRQKRADVDVELYDLRGWFALLAFDFVADDPGEEIFGSDAEEGEDGHHPTITTPEEIAEWLWVNVIQPAHTDFTEAPTIISSGETVDLFTVKRSLPMKTVLDNLATMACTDDQHFVWGIDETKGFYFQAIPTSSIATYTAGQNLVELVENSTAQIINVLTVVGGLREFDEVTTNFKKTFEHATSLADYRRRQRRMIVSEITTDDDGQTFADGFFGKNALPTNTYNVNTILESSTVPKPWNGKATISDTQRGTLDVLNFLSMDLSLGDTFMFRADVGKIPSAALFGGGGGSGAGGYVGASGFGADALGADSLLGDALDRMERAEDLLPNANDDEEPTDVPGPAPEGGSGLPRGFIIACDASTRSAIPDEVFYLFFSVSKGDGADLLASQFSLEWIFTPDDGTPSGGTITTSYERQAQSGSVEQWRCTAPLASAAEGTFSFRLESSTGSTFYYPNSENDYLKVRIGTTNTQVIEIWGA